MVGQCVFKKYQFIPTHLIVFLKKTELNLAEQCFFTITQFTPAPPIVIFKITMLN
jgi:hypothetical protein